MHRENGNKKNLSGKTQGIWKFCQNTGNLEILPKHREFGNFAKTQGIWKFCQNTGNLVCSSSKFTDSKGKRYFDIYSENFHFFSEAGKVCQVSFVYVIVTNHVSWHRENLRSDREKTGKTREI